MQSNYFSSRTVSLLSVKLLCQELNMNSLAMSLEKPFQNFRQLQETKKCWTAYILLNFIWQDLKWDGISSSVLLLKYICFGFQKPQLLLPRFFIFWQNYNGKWLPLQGVIFRLTALQLRMAKRIIFPFFYKTRFFSKESWECLDVTEVLLIDLYFEQCFSF